MIEIEGDRGESLLFDGASVAKLRHHGQLESARNPASTFREVRVTPKKRKRKDRDQEQRYDALLACSTIFSPTLPESETSRVDELVSELERIAASS